MTSPIDVRRITTHVLDTSTGRPAVGLEVVLSHRSGDRDETLAVAHTDGGGRVTGWNMTDTLPLGAYSLVFDTGGYFARRSVATLYPRVSLEFEIAEDAHYHVPLLLGPYSYTTYRGA